MKYNTCLKKRNSYLFFNLNILIVIILSSLLLSCKPKILETVNLNPEDNNDHNFRQANNIDSRLTNKANIITRTGPSGESFDIGYLKQKLNDNFASNKIKLNTLKHKHSDYTKKNFARLFKKFNYSNEDLLNKLYANFFIKNTWGYLESTFSKILEDDKNNPDQKLLTSLESFLEERELYKVMSNCSYINSACLKTNEITDFEKDALNKYEYDFENQRFKDGISLEKAKNNYKKFVDFIYKIQMDENRWWNYDGLQFIASAKLANYSDNINNPYVGIISSGGKGIYDLKYFLTQTTQQKSSIAIFNINGNHFILVAAIRHSDDSLTILCKDSLYLGGDNHTLTKAVKGLDLQNVKVIFNELIESKQNNGIDCGTFSLTNAAILADDLSNCTKDNINQYIESFSKISYFCTQDYVKELKEYYCGNLVECIGYALEKEDYEYYPSSS